MLLPEALILPLLHLAEHEPARVVLPTAVLGAHLVRALLLLELVDEAEVVGLLYALLVGSAQVLQHLCRLDDLLNGVVLLSEAHIDVVAVTLRAVVLESCVDVLDDAGGAVLYQLVLFLLVLVVFGVLLDQLADGEAGDARGLAKELALCEREVALLSWAWIQSVGGVSRSIDLVGGFELESASGMATGLSECVFDVVVKARF